MAKQIYLQLDYLKILKHRKHWNIYFLVAATSPTDPTKMAITTIPSNKDGNIIKLTKHSDNEIHFVPEGDDGGSGLFVLQQGMPADFSFQVRIWVMQSRRSTREIGNVIKDIGSFLTQNDGIQAVESKFGIKDWLIADKAINEGIGGIGNALVNIKDRNLGFVNLDEYFGHAFDNDPEKDFHNKVSTGFAELGWTWMVIG